MYGCAADWDSPLGDSQAIMVIKINMVTKSTIVTRLPGGSPRSDYRAQNHV
jgi:hypothetical protein